MKTSTAIVLGVVAVAAIGVGYFLLRGPRAGVDAPRTWGERLGSATGDVADAIGSVRRLFS